MKLTIIKNPNGDYKTPNGDCYLIVEMINGTTVASNNTTEVTGENAEAYAQAQCWEKVQ